MGMKKQHQVSIPDWVWERFRAADHKGRLTPAAFIREFLSQAAANLPVPPATATSQEPKPGPATPPKAKHALPRRHSRTASHRGGPCWAFAESVKNGLDRDSKGARVFLILTEYDNREVTRVWYDPETMERVHEPDGTPYYLLDVTKDGVQRVT